MIQDTKIYIEFNCRSLFLDKTYAIFETGLDRWTMGFKTNVQAHRLESMIFSYSSWLFDEES